MMLSKHNPIQDQIEMIALDQLVPVNRLVCKIESAIDFSFIYVLMSDMYSEVGRPSINPVILKTDLHTIPSVYARCAKPLKKLTRIWPIAGSLDMFSC